MPGASSLVRTGPTLQNIRQEKGEQYGNYTRGNRHSRKVKNSLNVSPNLQYTRGATTGVQNKGMMILIPVLNHHPTVKGARTTRVHVTRPLMVCGLETLTPQVVMMLPSVQILT